MKLKKKFTLILLAVLMVTLTVCGTISLFNNKKEVFAEIQDEQAILNTYILNDVFTVPDTKIVYEGKEYDASETLVVYPDGNVYAGKEHTLNQDGQYTIKYIAEVGGKRLIAEKQFIVEATYYSFEATGKDTNVLKSASCEFVDSFEMAPNDGTNGLRVSIPADTQFKVNQVIDLATLKNEPIITIYPYNDTFLLGRNGKTVEAHDIVVRLTDCNDSNNYIELQYHWTTRQQTNYFAPILYYMAGTCGSERTSFNGPTSEAENTFEYNGKFYNKRQAGFGMYSLYDRSDVYGTKKEDGTINVTSPGNKNQLNINETYVKSCGFSFYYNNETNEVKAGEILNKTSVQSPRLVANVGQKEIYGEKAFKGFSTGKVYLTVHAEQYNTNNSYADMVFMTNMEISNICGMTGEQLNKCENTAQDTTNPHIVIDGVDKEKTILYTQLGSEISIPKSQASDSNLKEWNTLVYFDYGGDKQTSISYTNGKFTANKVGTYTIMYKAVDAFGNSQTKLLQIKSRKGADSIPLTFSVEKVANAPAGAELVLPTPTLTTKNIGAFTKVYYSYNGGDYIPVENEGFFIEHVGEYSLKYVYGDIIHSYEEEYQFNAEASDNVKFNKYYLPTYFIKEAKYMFDDLYAYVYTEPNPKSVVSEVYVSEDGKDFLKIDSSSYQVKASESVIVKYVCNGKEIITESIPVVDVGFNGELKKGEYFQGEGFSWESDYDGTLYTNERTGNNTLHFVNVVSLSNFSFEYMIPKEYGNFVRLEFTLTDYYDRDNSFTVRVSNNGTGITFMIGDTPAYSNAKFRDSVNLFYYRSNKILLGSSYLDIGTEFTTDKAFFEIRLFGATGKNGIQIRQVGNSVLDAMTYDALSPLMSFADNLAPYVKVGEVITLNAPNIFDTFSPFLKSGLVLYATAPDGTNVQSLEGVRLERGCDPLQTYTFEIKTEGIYWVYFEYTDQNGNTTTINTSMSIRDEQPPKIELGSGYTSETVVQAQLNTTHEIQVYTVSDNKTNSDRLTMSILVLKPTGELYVETESSITLDCEGEWRIIYYCIDISGNVASKYYTVHVVK